jgi:hypothetical protein
MLVVNSLEGCGESELGKPASEVDDSPVVANDPIVSTADELTLHVTNIAPSLLAIHVGVETYVEDSIEDGSPWIA